MDNKTFIYITVLISAASFLNCPDHVDNENEKYVRDVVESVTGTIGATGPTGPSSFNSTLI